MRRLIIALVAGSVVAAVAVSAAVLDVNGGVIQYGEDTTLTCDTDGVYVDGWGLEMDTPASVTYVRIKGVSSACNGADMFVQVLNNGGEKITQGSFKDLLGDEDTPYKVTFPATPPQNIGGIKVAIEGKLP